MVSDIGTSRRTAGQILGAALAGLGIGVVGGAALAAGIQDLSSWAGAGLGGVAMGLISAWADASRRPGRPQPLWVRVIASALLAATIGWLLDVLLPAWPSLLIGGLVGAAAGAIAGRFGKIALGLSTGVLVGASFDLVAPEWGWSAVAASTIVVYRPMAGLMFGGREHVRFLAERVPPEEVSYVVPLIEQQGYVGVDYLRRFAERTGASFTRSPGDIGIVDSLDRLSGPGFDPGLVNLLVREFYEHTSRFRLSITPRWRTWMRVPYLLYRQTFARPLGQANAPFELEEVERGVASWIDTVDVDRDGIPDFRAWVRAYEDTMEPLYVGIYTVVRHEDTGYVSVGFPLPAGSFTATLLPSNHRGDGLLLSSRTRGSFPGHYLSLVDPETGEVSVAELTSFDEEIDVYVRDGELRTDHRFLLAGIEFMALHYSMERKAT